MGNCIHNKQLSVMGTKLSCNHDICSTLECPPCLICGQQDHSVIRWTRVGHMSWDIDLLCPIAMHDTWADFVSCKNDCIRYSFKAEKLLSKHGYCEEEVLAAFQVYETEGYGRISKLHSPVLSRAARTALSILCQNARHLHNFRREKLESEKSDGESIQPDIWG